MDCDQALELLSPFIDDMLDPEETRALRLHLEDCAACKAEYDLLARMREGLLRVPERPLPAEFDARLKEAIAALSETAPQRVARASRGRRRGLKPAASVAAVFAVGLLSLFLYARSDMSGPASGPLSSARDGAAVSEEAQSAASADADARADYDYVADAEAALDEAKNAAESEGAAAFADVGKDGASGSAPPEFFPGAADLLRPEVYEFPDRTGYPARGTTTGAHRLDEKAVCDELLREKLSGWTYKILSEEKRDGAFVYRVNLIANEAGMEFNHEIEVVVTGANKKVRVYYATEFMGL
ncbi:MAG: zf-HC2 domain-containing protein [Clostridiales Family XIII bacterium]|jgi:hypothetical protein|nr:zf-HC2 domain-containing protein [Clostridiales Family XIII bacterium]